jgi:hypothetical protein
MIITTLLLPLGHIPFRTRPGERSPATGQGRDGRMSLRGDGPPTNPHPCASGRTRSRPPRSLAEAGETRSAADLQTHWPKHLRRGGGATTTQEPPYSPPTEANGPDRGVGHIWRPEHQQANEDAAGQNLQPAPEPGAGGGLPPHPDAPGKKLAGAAAPGGRRRRRPRVGEALQRTARRRSLTDGGRLFQ